MKIAIVSCVLWGMTSAAAGPPVDSRDRPATPTYVFHGRLETAPNPGSFQVPLDLDPALVDVTTNRPLSPPDFAPPVRLTRYLSKAMVEQKVVPDETGRGRPAALLSIAGPKRTLERWLVADDPERNRLTSLIGLWRYMAVETRAQRDALFRQFESEPTREPTLIIGSPEAEKVVELPLNVGVARRIEELNCTVRVLEFYPDLEMDRRTGKVFHGSDKRRNPAARVEIERGNRREERWVFTKIPQMNTPPSRELAYELRLDYPLEVDRDMPDFVVVTIAGAEHEAWRRYRDRVDVQPITLTDRVEIPGSNYVFHVERFVVSGRLIEEFKPGQGPTARPALRIEVGADPGAVETLWLEIGKRRAVQTDQGLLTVGFDFPNPAPAGGHP